MGQGSSPVSAVVDKSLMTPIRGDTFPIYEEATAPPAPAGGAGLPPLAAVGSDYAHPSPALGDSSGWKF